MEQSMFIMPFRQVHLDFHTSEKIPNVGSMFQPEEFVRTLLKAKINRITCFARCHHGWLYYKSQRNPERIHPTLTRDLLREQIEVCQKHNIQVAVYTSVQWDHFTSEEHPDWLTIREDGSWYGPSLYQPGFNRKLCLNSPYRTFLKEHIKDILETLPTINGLFLDIVSPVDCNCKYCRKEMESLEIELSDPVARWKFALATIDQFKIEITNWIRSFRQDISIFYNSGHFSPKQSSTFQCYTHIELESLPSDYWGYIHFPIVARYVRTLRPTKCVVGQTGKFHTTWGDFHSYKNAAALRYESLRSLALCAQCSIGDQLHPLGLIDTLTYDLIGSVYSEVETKEPWCRGAIPVVEVGLMNPEEFVYPLDTKENIKEYQQTLLHSSLMGAAKMLEELQIQFDVLDSNSDFTPYKVIVLPDYIIMPQDHDITKRLQQKLKAFVQRGGIVLISYQSGFDIQKRDFVLKEFINISIHQNSTDQERNSFVPYIVDYLLPSEKIPSLSKTEHVMYRGGIAIQYATNENVEALAFQVAPYFNRTYKNYCSHQHAPSSGVNVGAAVLHDKNTHCVYFIHPLFQIYHEKCPKWCKTLFNDVLNLIGLERLIFIQNAPNTLTATMNYQPQENRIVIHLLHFIPVRRSQTFDIIEDVIPLFNLHCSISTNGRDVSRVALVPQGQLLDFTQQQQRISFVIPSLFGHQMIEVKLN